MPTLELLYPATLTDAQGSWKQGEVVPVTNAIALHYEDNPRFKVRGIRLGAEERAVAQADLSIKPKGNALSEAIIAAADELDADDDANFDRLGKPAVAALSAALGFTITAEDRDAALSQNRSGTLEAADVSAHKTLRITRSSAAKDKALEALNKTPAKEEPAEEAITV